MSYGYQGPPVTPFPGQQPPTSFGLPPGTPSAPNAPPYQQGGNVGFSQPPTSFGMPQQNSPYPSSSPYPSQNPPYPSQGPISSSMPQPLRTAQVSPYPQLSMPQPISSQSCYNPYPQPQGASLYSNMQSGPNPPYASNPAPSSYAPNPAPSPYESHPATSSYASPPAPSPYASNPAHSSYASPPSPYSPHPAPRQAISQQMNPSSAYPSGSYHGGQGTGPYSSPYVASVPPTSARYDAPAPRITEATSKLSPTVVPAQPFDSRSDAEALRTAMKGFGTDEKTIINILANRTNLQRLEIAMQFKTLFGKDLIKNLKSELSGNFENLVVAMMTPLPQYYAKELHDAMDGIGTDENVLIETLCTLSNHEIRVIKQAFETQYGQQLEDFLRDDTSGNFKRLMVSLCCGNRDESFNVDINAAQKDARDLLNAGELRFGTDESAFNAVLAQRNIFQLQQIFSEYANITGHDIEKSIKKEFSGYIEKALLTIVQVVKNRPAYFAERIYKSMKGAGTNDRSLIRLVVTRSEVDMGEIKHVFANEYGTPLENFISGDCSGHYKKCLLQLIS